MQRKEKNGGKKNMMNREEVIEMAVSYYNNYNREYDYSMSVKDHELKKKCNEHADIWYCKLETLAKVLNTTPAELCEEVRKHG